MEKAHKFRICPTSEQETLLLTSRISRKKRIGFESLINSRYQIAKRFNIHVSKLKTWNPKGTQVLRPGQLLTLYLPN